MLNVLGRFLFSLTSAAPLFLVYGSVKILNGHAAYGLAMVAGAAVLNCVFLSILNRLMTHSERVQLRDVRAERDPYQTPSFCMHLGLCLLPLLLLIVEFGSYAEVFLIAMTTSTLTVNSFWFGSANPLAVLHGWNHLNIMVPGHDGSGRHDFKHFMLMTKRPLSFDKKVKRVSNLQIRVGEVTKELMLEL